MGNDILSKLLTIDPEILIKVVRQDQRNPTFEITRWTVQRLSDKGIRNPDGLWLYSGEGNDGSQARPWSVVLKIIERTEEEVPVSDFWYWKRELLWVQSGLMERMPGPVKGPRFYGAEETSDGAWLWQEHIIQQRPDPWSLEDYAFAARQIGLWNGAYACGTPLPDEPWFTRRHYRSWYTQTNPEKDFKFPLNQKYITGNIRSRYDRLWTERELFYQVLETLPQMFSHFDSQRRNLFIRKGTDDQDELILVDWALCGLGPLGAEMTLLIGMSAALLDWPSSEVGQLDRVAFENYLKGLAEAGWSGDVDIVRLAYTAWLTIWFGVVFPNITALWCTPDFRPYSLQQFGFAEEDLCQKWLPVFHYALDCADEARSLMNKTG